MADKEIFLVTEKTSTNKYTQNISINGKLFLNFYIIASSLAKSL